MTASFLLPVQIAVLIMVIIIFKPFRLEPPTPKISVAETEIPTTQRSYCWDRFNFLYCVEEYTRYN